MVEGFEVGQRVLVEPGLGACGACDTCRRQLPRCPNGGLFGFSTPRGTLSVVGVFLEEASFPMQMLSVTGITLRAGLSSHECRPRLLAMLASGALDLKFAFNHTLPLPDGARAYRLFDSKEEDALKILLKP